MDSKQIQQIVEQEFLNVNEVIRTQLSSEVPLVEQIAHYIIDSGGKRMRPLLVLLACGACGKINHKSAQLAATIEFLHTATLLHDDVVDTSSLRRGRSTANAKWGNAPSVLVGDFLYSRAFELMVEIGEMPILNKIALATRVIAEGEVLQLTNIGNPDVSEERYMKVIHGKTAMLFEASTHAGAMLSSEDEAQKEALRDYGMHLGMAFQLIDDMLDYSGDSEKLGKNVGDDLAEGKPTLPLIFALQKGSEEQKQIIHNAIIEGGLDNVDEIIELVQTCGAIDYTYQKACDEGEKARKALDVFEDSKYKQALLALVDIAIKRDH